MEGIRVEGGIVAGMGGSRTDDGPAVCPVVATAGIISGKWTLLVLRDLADGPRRYSELERSLTGISTRTLSQRLRALELEGVIVRRELAEPQRRVEYCLTAKGVDLVPIVDAMRVYGRRWLPAGRADDPAGDDWATALGL
jgi:DNA-binding HxlR family transcriptional regulator